MKKGVGIVLVLVLVAVVLAFFFPSNSPTGLQTAELNEAPRFIGDSFQVNSSLSIDLRDYFVDPEGEALGFAVDDAQVSMQGFILTFTAPQAAGNYVVNVQVSDGTNTVYKPLTFTVQGEAPTQEEQVVPLSSELRGELSREPAPAREVQEPAPQTSISEVGISATCNSCATCDTCMDSTQTCQLTQSIASAADTTCITVSGASAVLDCQNFTITYNTVTTDTRGVIVQANGATIQNCLIQDSGSPGGEISSVPILVDTGVTGVTVNNNTLLAGGADERGVVISSTSSGVVVSNNSITANNIAVQDLGSSNIVDRNIFSESAIAVLGGGNAQIRNNRVQSSLVSLHFRISGQGARITNNTLFLTGTPGNTGMSFESFGSNATVENNTITMFPQGTIANNNAVRLNAVSNVTLRNNTINLHAVDGSNFAVLFSSGASFSNFDNNTLNSSAQWINATAGTENNFTNTTFANQNGSIRVGNFTLVGALVVNQSVLNISQNKSFVNSTTAPILNVSATVALRGVSFTNPKVVVDVEDDGTYVACAAPTCNESSYTGDVFVFDVGRFTSYAASETNNHPSIAQVILNNTNGAGYNLNRSNTSSNLTVFVINATDADGDSIQNITDWRVNGTSIAELNLPFETNVSVLTTGAVRDYSTAQRNGTLGNGSASASPVWIASGQVGGAFTFDGTNDLVDFGNYVFPTATTLSAWVNVRGVPNDAGGAIIQTAASNFFSATGLQIQNLSGVTKILFFIDSDAVNRRYWRATPASMPVDAWHHVVVTQSGPTDTPAIYLNGVAQSVSLDTSAGTVSRVSAPLAIGGYATVGGGYFNGSIDEVQILNRTLSAAQVLSLYDDGVRARHMSSLVPAELSIGNNWSVAVTPNDQRNASDGTTVISNSVTISNAHPSIAQVILNNTNGAGYNLNLSNTSSNLTVFVINATDTDNQSIQNITDWRVNGTSIAVLNMPFETNVSVTTTGAVKDYSTFINNGTLGNAVASQVPVWNASGKVGGSYRFDGVDDFIALPDATSLRATRITLEAWTISNVTAPGCIICNNGAAAGLSDGAEISWVGNGDIRMRVGNNAGADAIASPGLGYSDGVWHHVVGTYDGAVVRLYVDAVNVANTSYATGIAYKATSYPTIGARRNGASLDNELNGQVDEARIYNSSLSASQISRLYLDGSQSKHLETVVSGELVVGNNWSVAVTPNDNQNASDGTTVLSNGVVIQSVNNHPSIAQVILNSTDGSGESANASSSQEALTVVIINATDADNDSVQNITDFRIEGVSLAIVNLPFETNVSASLGVVRDYSTFGANGTLGNGTSGSEPLWNASGRVGGAYTFDGTHDIINVSGGNITYDMTVAAWIRTTSDANFKMIAANREATGDESGWEFYVDAAGSSGNVVLQVDNGPATGFREGTSNVRDGNWHHIVGVRNGSSFFVYVDGVVENGAHGPLSGSIASNVTTLIGRTPSLNDNANRRFFGTLDEFIIFNRSLSQEQVRRLYLDQSSGYHLQTILPQEVRKGENWSVAVTPNDNENASDGSTVISNTVTISNSAPTLAQAVLNSTDGSGSSTNTSSPSENLTIIAVSASDAEGESIQNVTDWRVNGSSITILNMPFESNISTAGGIVRDYSSSNISGLPGGGLTNGTPSWNSSGKVGGAYTFDGRDDYIDVTGGVSTLEGRTRGSIEFWFKSNDTTTAGVPVFGLSDKDTINDFMLIYVGDTTGSFANESFFFSNRRTGVDRLAFGVTNGHAFYKDMAWHHFVLVTGNGDNAIYVDGVRALNVSFLTGTGATNELTDIDSADTARIGSVVTGTGNFGPGTIDEFRFYNRTLTSQQVAQLYADGVAGRHAATLVSQEVGLGDVWSVAVTPNDLQPSTDGSTVTSNSVTISADNTHPTISQVILNNSNGAGYNLNISNASSNLTVFIINASDADSDSIQNITDWRVNGTGIAFFNMPFETNTTATTAGAVKDYSQMVNNGTLGSGTSAFVPSWNSSGRAGGAYTFDGTDDRLQIATNTFDGRTSFTTSQWVRFNNLDNPTFSGQALISALKTGLAHYYSVHKFDDETFEVDFRASGNDCFVTSPVQSLAAGVWYHVATTKNGSTIKIYVNGTEIKSQSTACAGAIEANTGTTMIGAQDGPGRFVNGTLDETYLFNKVLSAQQIAQLYQDGLAGNHLSTLVSQELGSTDVWSVAVTPNDNRNASDGTTVISNNVTISNAHPSIAQVILNSTDGSGYTANTSSTSENLTVFVINASDADSDQIQNITDWRVNGSAFAAFNMPFETNVSVLTSGEVKDYSVNRYNGTLGGGISGRQPLWNSSGKVGGAFTFTANDLIFVSDVPNIDGGSQQTLEAWVYPHNTPPDGGFYLTIMGTGDSTQPTWDTQQCRLLYMNPSGAETNKFYMDCGVNNANAVRDRRTAAEYAPGSWYHVVGVFNDGTINLYVNGVLDNGAGTTGSSSVNTNAYNRVWIGNQVRQDLSLFGDTVSMNGTVDEVKVYTRALSAAQIYRNYLDGNRSKHVETIVSGELSIGQNWTVAVTPNDQRNASDGTTVISNNVTILQESEVVKADSSDPVNIYSSLLNYTVTITATNDSFANISLVETYPAQVTYVSSQPSPSSGNNVFAIPNLSLGQSYIVNITVNVTPTTLNNTVINNTVNISYHSSTGANLSAGDTENTTIVSAFFADHCDISSSSFTLDHSLYCANITVNPGVTITLNHAAVSPVEIVVTETFNLSSTATIQGTGAGFAGGLGTISCGNAGSGPGAGGNGCALPGGGAGHGGNGGSATSGGGGAYGSSFAPTTRGSGGGGAGDSGGSGGAGGGAVRISAGTAYIDGNVLVNGVDGFNGGGRPGGGGGSGGSISITANALAGSGSLQAKAGAGGGGGSAGPGGSGAGGRILVRFNTSTFNISQANVTGQAAQGGSSQAGEAGTLGFIESDASVLNISQGWRWESTDGHVSFVNVTVQNGTLDRAVGELVSVSDTYLADGVTMTGVSGTTEINATRYLHRQGAVSFLSGTRFALGYNSTFDDFSTTYAAGSRLTLRNISVSEAYFNPTAAQVFNLSANTRLANNSVRVLSSVIPGLNVSANISLYNITQGDPFPIVDIADNGSFVPCTPPRCVELSFVNGVFVYSVTGFTSYSSDASVSLTKDDSPDPVTAGQTLSYTLFINNSNGNIENVTVIETYPSQVTFNGSQPIPTVGNNTFVIGNLSANGTFQINITVNVSSAVANGTVINNTANLTFNNASGSSFFVNVTEGTTVIAGNSHPTIAQAILNNSNGAGYNLNISNASSNLTVFIINASDADSDSIQNITDWRVNGTSMAIVNMPFETNSTNLSTDGIRDYSGFSNDGTLGGGTSSRAPVWTAGGKVGGAYVFDGVDDYIAVSDVDVPYITVSAWINYSRPDPGGFRADFAVSKDTLTAGNRGYGIYAQWNGGVLTTSWAITRDGTNVDQIGVILSPSFLSTQHHLVGTYDGTTMRFYIDGELNGSLSVAGTLFDNTQQIEIGRRLLGGNANWQGTIDDVLILNRSLSAQQVYQLYLDGNRSRHAETFVSSELRRGDIWSVAVTPNDQRNASDGTTVISNNVTISNAHPSIAQVILNSTDGSGYLGNNASNNENLTVFIINATDADNDSIQNITDWRLNGTSIAVLNLPFETNVSLGTTGAIRDYSSFQNNGTSGNGTGTQPLWNLSGKAGGAFTFDGVDDIIEVNDSASLDLYSTITIAAWVYPAADNAGAPDVVSMIVNKEVPGGANAFEISRKNSVTCVTGSASAGTFLFFLSNLSGLPDDCSGWTTGGASLPLNTWSHVALTYNGSNVSAYVDGVLTRALPANGTLRQIEGPVKISGRGDPVPRAIWNGSIDEVLIFNHSLSGSQVAQLYQDGLAGLHATTFVHNETATGDIWSVAVTPNDQRNASDGTTVLSNNVTILADDNNHPVIAQVILNSSDGSGFTANNASNSENLTVFIINASDADSDGIQNITDWRVNGTSVALMNFPFETNVSVVTSGAVRDYSSFGYNATLGAGAASAVPVWNSSGRAGGAYTFDGSDDLIQVASPPLFGSTVSVELWIRRDAAFANGDGVTYGKSPDLPANYGWLLHPNAAGTISFYINNGSAVPFAASTSVLAQGVWHHVVGTYDGSAVRIYVNGTLEGTGAASGAIQNAAGSTIDIGHDVRYVGTRYLTGSVDEVRIYNRTLTQSQIQRSYADGLAGLHATNLSHNETSVGDIWSVAVTPNDQRNASDGTTVLSNNVTILADDNNHPTIAQVILNSTDGSGSSGNNATTSENLTVFIINATDADNDGVQNITDWRLNGTSMALINLPFETNVTLNTSGAVRDYTTFVNNFTLGNGSGALSVPLYNSSGKVGAAYTFDGLRTGMSGPNVAALNAPSLLTVSAWVHPVNNLSSNNPHIVAKYVSATDDGWLFRLTSLATFDFDIRGASFELYRSAPGVAPLNTWTHLAAVYNSSASTKAQLYVNGQPVSATLLGGTTLLTSGTAPVTVGYLIDATNQQGFNGSIDEVLVINDTLSANQIAQLYADGLAGRHMTNLVHNETTTGDVWSVAATPNDQRNASDGTTVLSNNVTILAEECPLNIATSTTLSQNITCPVTAIVVSADNVTLDCAGFTVVWDTGGTGNDSGVQVGNRRNVTVKNCVLVDGNELGQSGIGVNLTSTNESVIHNNTIYTNGTSADYGVFLNSNANNNTVQNNTIRTQGTSIFNDGVVTQSFASHNFILSNVIVTNGSSNNEGILFQTSNNTAWGNIIMTRGSSNANRGVRATGVSNVTIVNNSISTSGTDSNLGVHLTSATDSVVANNTVSTTGTSSDNVGIFVDTSVLRNNITGNIVSTNGTFGARGIGIQSSVIQPGSQNRVVNNSVRSVNGHGIQLISFAINNTIAFNVVNASGSGAVGIDIETSSHNNTFEGNNVTSASSYGVQIITSSDSSFNNTRLDNPLNWVSAGAGTVSSFSNTTFNQVLGSILLANFTLGGGLDIQKVNLSTTANHSFVDSTNLSFLNTSAQITLRSLAFTDPRPAVDFNDDGVFADCDPPQCVEVSFNGSTYVFNVSSFTSYAAQENLTFLINLSIDKFDSPDPVARGSQLSYQIQINSTGNASALNVTLVETYPPNVSFVSSEPAPSSGNNTFSIGNLTNGSSFLVNITVNVSSAVANGTLLNNSVQVMFTNSSGVNSTVNDSELTTVLGAPVIVSIKSDTPDPVTKGSTLNYTILVNNTGDDTAFNITLSEVYPVGVSFVSAQPTPTGNSTFGIGTLAPGDSFLVNITVIVGSNVANGTILNNSVNLSFRNATGGQSTASDSELTTVLGFSNVSVTKTDSPDPVNNGSTLSYTITITNSGDDTAFNVTAVEGYDANVTFNGSSPVPTVGNNTFNVGNLSPGQSTTLNITVNVSAFAAGVLNNTVNVSSENLSGDVSLATAFAETNVTVVGPAPAPAGGAGGGGGGAAFTRNTQITRNETVVTPVPLTFPFAQFPPRSEERPVQSVPAPTEVVESRDGEEGVAKEAAEAQEAPIAGRSWSWPVLSLPEFKWSSLPKLPDFGLPSWYRTAVAGILGSFLVLLLLGVVSRSLARQAERRLVERRQFISTARPVWKKGAVAHMKGLFGGSEEKSLVPSVLSQRSSASVQNIDAELDALKADLKKLKYRVHHTARKGKNV